MEKSSIYLQLKNEKGDRLTVTGSTTLLPNLAIVYERLYMLGIRAEQEARRRGELASNDQAEPDSEILAGESFTDGEEPEKVEP